MDENTTVPSDSRTLLMRKEDFEDLLNGAAERGAERALARLGLENGHAARDIGEYHRLPIERKAEA